MLILAGVSLNATIGNNGIVTKAMAAKEAQELAKVKEDLEYMFLDYNIGNNDEDIAVWLDGKKNDGEIDDFKFWKVDGEDSFTYLITKEDNMFYVAKSGDQYYATQTETNLDSIGAGITVATQDAFDASTGNLSFELTEGEKSTLYFAEEISGELNFEIKGGTVDIYITQDMNLTNSGLSRSAIDIYSGATLNLHIAEGKTLTVDSGYSTQGATGNMGQMKQNQGGQGGYAGIHVPEGATLNLYGNGTVIAFGGDASAGGAGTSDTTVLSQRGNRRRRRWRSWCRNRWKWWKWWRIKFYVRCL
jgi:hypothetical protein